MPFEPDTRQLQAWTALASLFVDTELTPGDHRAVADRLVQLGFDRHQAEHMLRHDIAPVFATNLWSPAGEWTPWSETDVHRIMAQHWPGNLISRMLHRLMVRLSRRQADEAWAELGAQMKAP